MISELTNLPSLGLLSNPGNVCWEKHPAMRFTAVRQPEQELQRDDTTEALVRLLRRPHQETAGGGAGAGKKGARASGKGVKRAAETGNDEQQKGAAAAPAGGTQKKLAVSASLLAGVAAARGAAAATGAGPSGQNAAAAGGSGSDFKRVVFSQEELKAKTVKDLQDALKQRGLPVSGKKEVLMQRMIDYQRRQKMAAMGQGA